MKSWLRLLPFAVFLFILPFPGTVALRLTTLAIGLILCAWIWHKEGFAQVPAKTVLLLWVACALLSLATAIDPAYSLGEIKNEIGYAMAAYLGFIALTRTRNDASFFIMVLILGNLTFAILALWEHFSLDTATWNERGLAGGSGSYSTYLLALLPVLLWAGCVLPHKHRWSVVSGLIALQLIVAVLIEQRAFWLVFALQALFALYLLRARGFIAISARRVQAIGAAAVLLSCLAIVGATATRDAVSWTQDPRVTSWPAVAGRILEHPLTGKGFGRQTMKNAYPDLVSQKYPLFWHPHNLFLNYGIAMGIPGMIAIVLLFFTLLRKFWELSRADDRIIAMAGICGVLLVIGVVARNLTNDFFQRDLALLFWSIAGMLLGYAGHAGDASNAPGRSRSAADK
jgi:O-antigen ligase